jgi:SPP1 family predicted phage head-tail adaptor
MNAGKLDRRVTILVRSDVQEEVYGTKQASWNELATVSAEVQDALPSRADRLAAEMTVTKRPARVRMRWRDDVSQANRVRIDGVEMRIVAGPAMLGRRVGLEIMVEALSTEGQQP